MTDNVRRPWWAWGACGDLPERDLRNLRRFTLWSLAWAISFVAATFLLAEELVPAGPIQVAVAVMPTILGLGAIWSYVVFLRQADELQRKVHLEALAAGFGTGMIFMMGYRLLERIGAPELDMNDPLLVMLLVWAVWQMVAARRYA
jgi:hypothetical protein